MRIIQLPLIMGLLITTNLQALDRQKAYCEPEKNPTSAACTFKQNTEIPSDILQNVIAAKNSYRKLGQSEQDAAFHAINLEMIKVQSKYNQDIEYLENLWRDIKANKLKLGDF